MRRSLEGRDFVHSYTQNLAHKLKSPISAIRGAAELLNEPEMPDAKRTRFLANITAESDCLQQIVERVMTLASLEAQGEPVTREEISLGGVVGEVVSTLEPDLKSKSLHAETDVGPVAGVRLEGDRFLVYHGILNLARNAVEFSPSGGAITIRALLKSETVRIEVTDDGPGVPDYALERVFERFFSLPRPDTGRKSTGLGLSFAREIARVHGGDVGVENRLEGGALVWMSLPVLDR